MLQKDVELQPLHVNWTGYRFLPITGYTLPGVTAIRSALMMNSAQVVETSVTATDNSPFRDYTHDQTTLSHNW